MSLDQHQFAAIYRREVGRCTATLVRVLGDLDLAEDAVAEAFTIAAERWAAGGIPPNPGGWITTTAKNRAIDRLRRESSRQRREREASTMTDESQPDHRFLSAGELDVVADDQLRLIFMCCHPALSPESQVALTLRLLGGLTTLEIARAFLASESTMGQRLTRAKRKISDTHMSYRIPDGDELPRRLVPVLATIYLVYTEGHSATSGRDLVRHELTAEAIRLGRTLAGLLPEESEALGLLALMLLTEARSSARFRPDGSLVRLAEQDRSLWDQELIAEGHGIVRRCIERDRPGPYQIQAAIAAVHADSPTASATDWSQIEALYDQLLRYRNNGVVLLNRAVAILENRGPDAALDALEGVDLPNYHLFHATKAEALERAGRHDAAVASLRQAIGLATNEAELRHLESRLAALD